jgi:sarcosine oxidase, subunit alpha
MSATTMGRRLDRSEPEQRRTPQAQPFRTLEGGRIDRSAPLRFRFDGRIYTGFAGDTLASALLANGVHLMGRSFKYHRPRGPIAAGSEEPNALVSLQRGQGRFTPNLRATQIELHGGLVACSQNRWPSLAFDINAVNDLISPVLAAGFYYKTFMQPKGAWARLYEPLIRRAAGLGQAPGDPDPDTYTQRYAHCDVLIAGAGPAGLAAALAAAQTGARVILADEQAEMGGALLHETGARIEGRPAALWLREALSELARQDKVVLLSRTTVFGYFNHNFLGLAQRLTDHLAPEQASGPRERLWQVRARQVVLATGAIERPLAFPDNDRPGIMLAASARTYLNRYGVRPGTRALVFTADDSAYAAALDLAQAGVEIAAIADLRPVLQTPGPAAALAAGLQVHPGAVVTGTQGRLRVTTAHLGTCRRDGTAVGAEAVSCDLILMSGGWTPAVHLFCQSRGKLVFDDGLQAFVPGAGAQAERSVGACRGSYDLAACLAEGYGAGEQAARAAGVGGAVSARRFGASGAGFIGGGFNGATPHGRDPARVKAFVDFQNDVTAKDVTLALREGFRSIEHVKRYTTSGMATDQGKTSNMNTLAIAADALGTDLPQVGLTTFRMPYTPVTFGSFAGHSRGALFDPVRHTPIHGWAAAHGAVFEDVGLWQRAWYFAEPGLTMAEAVRRESRNVRATGGLFDASTLGKIEIVGPDAAEFLNRLYTNSCTTLAPGRCRYGLLLNEAGFVMDDGIIARIAQDRFHVTTTTGGAPRVLAHLEDYLQTEFTDLKVWLTSTTEQWAVIAVQGPNARKVLKPLVEGIDIAASAMPHMSLREGRICGVPMRLFRVSFTGELGFEVNVPSGFGLMVWEAIAAQGQRFGMTPYGTQAMHVLRAEKGYIIIGQETDGTVTPGDLGLAWALGRNKRDFVGKRSLARPDMVKPDRKQLVGLLPVDPRALLEEGAQITAEPAPARGSAALGHVTSAYDSPAAGRSIALALVKAGRSRLGETLHVPMPGGPVAVTVVDPVFYDKEGARLHG